MVEFIVSIAMLPTAGGFVAYVISDPNLSSILGFSLIMSVSLIIISLGVAYSTAKQFFGK